MGAGGDEDTKLNKTLSPLELHDLSRRQEFIVFLKAQ